MWYPDHVSKKVQNKQTNKKKREKVEQIRMEKTQHLQELLKVHGIMTIDQS